MRTVNKNLNLFPGFLYFRKYFLYQVDTPHGSSTVYVHGFGTDDTYHDAYAGHQAYGYGHIDPYLNHKQGTHPQRESLQD